MSCSLPWDRSRASVASCKSAAAALGGKDDRTATLRATQKSGGGRKTLRPHRAGDALTLVLHIVAITANANHVYEPLATRFDGPIAPGTAGSARACRPSSVL